MNAKKYYLKDNYHEARKAMVERMENPKMGTRADEPVYSFRMLQCLRDMAKENVYPDGSFGDDECNIWEMFSMLVKD